MRQVLSRLVVFFCVVPSAWSADPLARLVTIYRDNFGVPHIVGETEQAVFFGYGYAHAKYHLERMMLQYRDAARRYLERRRWGSGWRSRIMITAGAVITCSGFSVPSEMLQRTGIRSIQ